jgi:hypothetical protein
MSNAGTGISATHGVRLKKDFDGGHQFISLSV